MVVTWKSEIISYKWSYFYSYEPFMPHFQSVCLFLDKIIAAKKIISLLPAGSFLSL